MRINRFRPDNKSQPPVVSTPIPLSFRIMSCLARFAWVGRRLHKKARKDTAAIAARSIRDPEILARTVNDPDIWPLFEAMLLSTFDRMHLRMDGTLNDIRITQNTDYSLENLKVPVLVIHGTKEPMLPFGDHARTFARRVPDAEFLVVKGGEHVAIFTHQNEVRPGVARFMRRSFSLERATC